MLTLRGIYGREMYETWYKMTVMLQSGLDITPAITHRFGFRDFEAAFAAAGSGDSGKVIMDWTVRPDVRRRSRRSCTTSSRSSASQAACTSAS